MFYKPWFYFTLNTGELKLEQQPEDQMVASALYKGQVTLYSRSHFPAGILCNWGAFKAASKHFACRVKSTQTMFYSLQQHFYEIKSRARKWLELINIIIYIAHCSNIPKKQRQVRGHLLHTQELGSKPQESLVHWMLEQLTESTRCWLTLDSLWPITKTTLSTPWKFTGTCYSCFFPNVAAFN